MRARKEDVARSTAASGVGRGGGDGPPAPTEAREATPAGSDRAVRVDYRRFVRSAAWRDSPARRAELSLSGRRCRLCDRGPPEVRVEVHHRTYERLGRERVEDLTTLCHECHPTVTDMLRRRRYGGLALPALVDTPRVLPTREFARDAPERTR